MEFLPIGAPAGRADRMMRFRPATKHRTGGRSGRLEIEPVIAAVMQHGRQPDIAVGREIHEVELIYRVETVLVGTTAGIP
jgi:hypothetical protein